VVIENNYGAAQYFNNVTDGQQIKIKIPRSLFDNTDFSKCDPSKYIWFAHTADVAWRFKPCDKEWWQVDYYLSQQVCTLNINTCCPGENCCTPTAITLSSFTVQPGNGSVTLNWVTESETTNAAFNILRADKKIGAYKQIAHIQSKGSSTQGASYEYIDTSVQNGKKYWYKLQDVDLGGKTEDHGPVKAKPKKNYQTMK
jgi:hypothetical protein